MWFVISHPRVGLWLIVSSLLSLLLGEDVSVLDAADAMMRNLNSCSSDSGEINVVGGDGGEIKSFWLQSTTPMCVSLLFLVLLTQGPDIYNDIQTLLG